MSKYGAPTEFNFGHNIHDFDPDKQRTSGKRMQNDSGTAWYEREPDVLSIHSLVSEIKQRITDLTEFVRKDGSLIQYEDRSSKERGKRNSRSSSGGGIPPLRVKDISFDKLSARILAAREITGNYGAQVAVKIAYRGSQFIWYLDKTSNHLKFIVDTFTTNEDRWIDKEFLLYLETDDFNGREKIITDVKPETTPRKK